MSVRSDRQRQGGEDRLVKFDVDHVFVGVGDVATSALTNRLDGCFRKIRGGA